MSLLRPIRSLSPASSAYPGGIHKGHLLRCDTPDAIKKSCGTSTLEAAFISIIEGCDKKS